MRATKAGYSKEEPLTLTPLPPVIITSARQVVSVWFSGVFHYCPPSGRSFNHGAAAFSHLRGALFSSLLSVHSVLSVCCTTSPEPPEPFS